MNIQDQSHQGRKKRHQREKHLTQVEKKWDLAKARKLATQGFCAYRVFCNNPTDRHDVITACHLFELLNTNLNSLIIVVCGDRQKNGEETIKTRECALKSRRELETGQNNES